MADLIAKFFQTELTEAEDQELSQTLLNSSEDSVRFAEAATAAYARYGLPEPRWPGDPDDFPRPSSGGGAFSMGVVLAVAGLASWAGWHFRAPLASALGSWSHHPPAISSQAPPPGLSPLGAKAAVQPKAPVDPGRGAGDSQAFPAEDQAAGESPAENKPVPAGSLTGHSASLPAADRAASHTPPADQGQPASPKHDSIEVVVHRLAPGPVTVQVLDGQGVPLLLLFQGILKEGNWAFDWNGRLPDGQAAAPGRYQIQVQSGGRVQAKNVLIR
ncbi:MAG TPA: FlgD immunoglobulin-like domain containing protein [bacterium]|nr:FlgD immunoglobulin-like domain containing protein [bacterium]